MTDLKLGGVAVQRSSMSTRAYKAAPCSLMLPVRPDCLDQALAAYREAGFAGHYSGLSISGLRDLSFLSEFPDMLYLTVEDGPVDPRHLEPLHNLRGLEIPTSRSGIDFSWFPQLEVFSGKWHADHRNLDQLQELRALTVAALQTPADDLSPLANITRLDRLQLSRPKIRSLDGIETLEDLQLCEIFGATALASLDALGNGMPGLRELDLDKCQKIDSYAPIAAIERLRRLKLSECAPMENLQWARSMDYLDLFSFVDTNVVDGDMTPLLELPRLRYVGTMSKRHYSHSFEQMLEMFEQRWRHA